MNETQLNSSDLRLVDIKKENVQTYTKASLCMQGCLASRRAHIIISTFFDWGLATVFTGIVRPEIFDAALCSFSLCRAPEPILSFLMACNVSATGKQGGLESLGYSAGELTPRWKDCIYTDGNAAHCTSLDADTTDR